MAPFVWYQFPGHEWTRWPFFIWLQITTVFNVLYLHLFSYVVACYLVYSQMEGRDASPPDCFCPHPHIGLCSHSPAASVHECPYSLLLTSSQNSRVFLHFIYPLLGPPSLSIFCPSPLPSHNLVEACSSYAETCPHREPFIYHQTLKT